MVNCNPETVSTDYDTSDRLYFEPLTLEDVLEVVHAEQASGPVAGVIVQLGGQTPLGLARALAAAGVPVVGTSPEAIHLAEHRGEFGALLAAAGLPAPKHGTAATAAAAKAVAAGIGYPVLVRPSYVLGGRGMEIVYDDDTLASYVTVAAEASPEHPILIDRFLDDAIEIDVDALFDGEELYLAGVMEHIEEAGIHSGRLGLCPAPNHPGPRGHRAYPGIHRGDRARGGGARAAQRPVRADRRGAVRAGGEPPRVAHGPVRVEGDRGPGGQGGGPGHARRERAAAAGRGAAAGYRGTAAPCRWTPRSRSRRWYCRSAGSGTRRDAAWTRSSARRCAPPAR